MNIQYGLIYSLSDKERAEDSYLADVIFITSFRFNGLVNKEGIYCYTKRDFF